MNSLSLMFIAGEASGDALAAELLYQIRNKSPVPIKAFGAGGERLRSEGAELSIDLTQHAVVGLWEVLKHYKTLKGLFMKLLDEAIEKRPEIVILVDYPGFNLRFAKALKKHIRKRTDSDWSPKVVQFISPQIWAWHESRIHQIARDVDMILSIFPFEKEWYQQRAPGLRVEYVGHPLLDRYKEYASRVGERVPTEPYHVLFLPGSREKELSRHLPVLAEAAPVVAAALNVKFRVVLPDEKLQDLVERYFPKTDVEICTRKLAESLLWADVAVASSGTVTMECSYFQVPTVIFYKTSFFTAFFGRLFIKVKCIGMPNILSGNRHIYPEFIQGDATAANLSKAVLRFLAQPEVRSQTQHGLRTMLATLGGEGASQRAADKVLELFEE
ncbi:MAG: lipid-A-disaccharide synthase [Limisphaerales bacterium]|jgi:lipid-A-disaccharide synthase|nr:lipid-A-disaccharide synthase [Verrucomicrobiota bacterium]